MCCQWWRSRSAARRRSGLPASHTRLSSDSLLRRDHLGHTADAGIARIQVVLLVHDPVTGFDELTRTDAHAVADRTEHFPGAIQLQELPVLPRCHPRLAVRIEVERAHQIPHLHRLEEPAVTRVDDDAVFLAVADPDVT